MPGFAALTLEFQSAIGHTALVEWTAVVVAGPAVSITVAPTVRCEHHPWRHCSTASVGMRMCVSRRCDLNARCAGTTRHALGQGHVTIRMASVFATLIEQVRTAAWWVIGVSASGSRVTYAMTCRCSVQLRVNAAPYKGLG